MKLLLFCTAYAGLLGSIVLWLAMGGLKGLQTMGRRGFAGRFLPLAVILIVLAMDMWGIAGMLPREKELVTVQAVTDAAVAPDGAELYLIDVTVDGVKQVKAAEASGHWIKMERGYHLDASGLQAEEGRLDTLNLLMPVGTDRCLLMKAGPEQLQCIVTFGDYASLENCYADLDGEVFIHIPNSELPALKQLWRKQAAGFAVMTLIAYACVLLGCIILRKKQGVSDTKPARRNNAVEFYRFLGSVIIILHHAQPMGGLKGYLCVEFFLLVGGWFMMAHFDRCAQKGTPSLTEYMLGRIRRLYPYFIFIWLLTYLVQGGGQGLGLLGTIGQNIGELLMVQCAGLGIHEAIVGNDWFLSAMLLASGAVYALLCWNRECFIRRIAPVAILVILGWFCLHCQNLDQTVWNEGPGGLLTRGLWRALAEISLACCLYELCTGLKKRFGHLSRSFRAWASVGEVILLSLLGIIMFTWREKTQDILPLLLMAVLTCSLMTSKSCLSEVLNTKLSAYLGSLSMPMYLCHTLILSLMYQYAPELHFVPRFVIGTLLSMGFAALTLPLVGFVEKLLGRAASKLPVLLKDD